MNHVWIVLANAKMSTIYSASPSSHDFTLVKTLSHPEGSAKNSDFTTDRPGHFLKGSKSSRGSFEPENEPKEIEKGRFTKQICEALEQGRVQNAYQSIIVIAEPHFYGLIKLNANHHVQDKIKKHVAKDYTHFSTKELKKELETSLAHDIRLLLLNEEKKGIS